MPPHRNHLGSCNENPRISIQVLVFSAAEYCALSDAEAHTQRNWTWHRTTHAHSLWISARHSSQPPTDHLWHRSGCSTLSSRSPGIRSPGWTWCQPPSSQDSLSASLACLTKVPPCLRRACPPTPARHGIGHIQADMDQASLVRRMTRSRKPLSAPPQVHRAARWDSWHWTSAPSVDNTQPHPVRCGPICVLHEIMGLKDSTECVSGHPEQTMHHIIEDCPLYRPTNGEQGLVTLDDDTRSCLASAELEIWAGKQTRKKKWTVCNYHLDCAFSRCFEEDMEVIWSVIKHSVTSAMHKFIPRLQLRKLQFPRSFTLNLQYKHKCL